MRRIPRLSRPIDRAVNATGPRRPLQQQQHQCLLRAAAPFSTTTAAAARPAKEFTERLRSKIWGTDYAPGREDPYSFQSPMRAVRKPTPADPAAQQTKQANIDGAGVAGTTAATATTGPRRMTRQAMREEDVSYEPAKTWHGLEWIGGEGSKLRQEKEFTVPARKTMAPNVALRKALIEVYTARSEGVSFESIYDSRKDRSVGVELSAAEDGTAVIQKKIVDRNAAKAAKKQPERISSEEIQAWRRISLHDPEIKFAVVKRVMQLTGTYISDPVIAKSNTAGILLNNINKKPVPAKLFERLQRDQKLSRLPNVKVSRRRITPIDKEIQVGRWKVIEQKLLDRNLPVTGHRV